MQMTMGVLQFMWITCVEHFGSSDSTGFEGFGEIKPEKIRIRVEVCPFLIF